MAGQSHRLVSGTALEWEGAGILIEGPSGSGKSDLAIRLIDRGARLISDDVVELHRVGGSVLLAYPAAAPKDLFGRIEARGIGIVSVPALSEPVVLDLVVRLVAPERVERLPEIKRDFYLDVAIRTIELAPFEISCAAKVRLALHHSGDDIIAAP